MAIFNKEFLIESGFDIDESDFDGHRNDYDDAQYRNRNYENTLYIIKNICDSAEFEDYEKPEFVDYFSEDDFRDVYTNWLNYDSSVICICNFDKSRNYKPAIKYIIKEFNKYKKNTPGTVGHLVMSDKYNSVDLNYKL